MRSWGLEESVVIDMQRGGPLKERVYRSDDGMEDEEQFEGMGIKRSIWGLLILRCILGYSK